MSAVRANLAFTCVHEADHLPPLDPEADQLFKYGRYLEKKDGPKDFDAVARFYRIAAAYGHYKANNNLQLLVSEGFASSPDPSRETIDLVEQLIKAGVPGGYYNMGHYLELGYGVKLDEDKARRYFRKAADLGSPEAQAYVGELLSACAGFPPTSHGNWFHTSTRRNAMMLQKIAPTLPRVSPVLTVSDYARVATVELNIVHARAKDAQSVGLIHE